MQIGNDSIESEKSSMIDEERRKKEGNLLEAFEKLDWNIQKYCTQNEIRDFLNNRTNDKQFDPTLTQELFRNLYVNGQNQITVEDFLNGYLQFEKDIKKKYNEFHKQFKQEQKNKTYYEEQSLLYKSEKLSPEGFCENAKLTVEINFVNIQKEIEGNNSIIIKVIYNNEIKEKNY